MATSSSIDFNLTARDVVTYAMRKIGVLDITQSADADEADAVKTELEVMLKEWALNGPFLFTKRDGSQALSSDTSTYDLSTNKPIRILEARYRNANGRDLPMEELTREEYLELPIKTSNGIPTTYYFNPQTTTWNFYTWPVLLTATTETIEYTYQRRIEDIDDLSNDIDVPQEFLSTVGYNLAARIIDDYGVEDKIGDRVLARSEALLQKAMTYERDERFIFYPHTR